MSITVCWLLNCDWIYTVSFANVVRIFYKICSLVFVKFFLCLCVFFNRTYV